MLNSLQHDIDNEDNSDYDIVEEDNPILLSSQVVEKMDIAQEELKIANNEIDEQLSIEIIHSYSESKGNFLYIINETNEEDRYDYISKNTSCVYNANFNFDQKNRAILFISDFLSFKFRYNQKLKYFENLKKENIFKFNSEQAILIINKLIYSYITNKRRKSQFYKDRYTSFKELVNIKHLSKTSMSNKLISKTIKNICIDLKYFLLYGQSAFNYFYLDKKIKKCLSSKDAEDKPQIFRAQSPMDYRDQLKLIKQKIDFITQSEHHSVSENIKDKNSILSSTKTGDVTNSKQPNSNATKSNTNETSKIKFSHKIDYINIQSKVDCWKNQMLTNSKYDTQSNKSKSFIDSDNKKVHNVLKTDSCSKLLKLKTKNIFQNKLASNSICSYKTNSSKSDQRYFKKNFGLTSNHKLVANIVFKRHNKFKSIMGISNGTSIKKQSIKEFESKHLIPISKLIEQKSSTQTNNYLDNKKAKTPDPYISIDANKRIQKESNFNKHFESDRLKIFNSPLGFLKFHRDKKKDSELKKNSNENLQNIFNELSEF